VLTPAIFFGADAGVTMRVSPEWSGLHPTRRPATTRERRRISFFMVRVVAGTESSVPATQADYWYSGKIGAFCTKFCRSA
jgi:hypothetical protein